MISLALGKPQKKFLGAMVLKDSLDTVGVRPFRTFTEGGAGGLGFLNKIVDFGPK